MIGRDAARDGRVTSYSSASLRRPQLKHADAGHNPGQRRTCDGCVHESLDVTDENNELENWRIT